MLYIFAFILSGAVAGYLLRNRPATKHVGKVINIIIILLLFFLGVSTGSNQQVIRNFRFIGFDAFMIALAGTAGSILCAWLLYEKFFRKGKDRL